MTMQSLPGRAPTACGADRGVWRGAVLYGALALASMVLLPAGCMGRAREYPLEEGVASLNAGDWRAAEVSLRRYLLEHPQDPAGHFYLGRCYLNGGGFFPDAAEGEFRLAITLFKEQGGKSPIPEYSDQYFELRCHLEIAKVYMRLLNDPRVWAQGPPAMQRAYAGFQQAADDARAIDPESPDVKQLDELVRGMKPSPPRMPAGPTDNMPSTTA